MTNQVFSPIRDTEQSGRVGFAHGILGWAMRAGANLSVSDLKDKIEAETKAAQANQQV